MSLREVDFLICHTPYEIIDLNGIQTGVEEILEKWEHIDLNQRCSTLAQVGKKAISHAHDEVVVTRRLTYVVLP